MRGGREVVVLHRVTSEVEDWTERITRIRATGRGWRNPRIETFAPLCHLLLISILTLYASFLSPCTDSYRQRNQSQTFACVNRAECTVPLGMK